MKVSLETARNTDILSNAVSSRRRQLVFADGDAPTHYQNVARGETRQQKRTRLWPRDFWRCLILIFIRLTNIERSVLNK